MDQDIERTLQTGNLPIPHKPSEQSKEASASISRHENDPSLDPTHPQNWPKGHKWTVTIIISGFSFCTMMTSTMIVPALPQIASTLRIQSKAETQLMLSSYVLSYAFGPFLWGPMSELFGRVVILQIASTWFFIWNMICGFAHTSGSLVAGRILSGIGASAALAIGTGVLSDCWKPEQRGRSLGVYTFMPLLGPTIGPIIGGVIAQRSTWRWAFWSMSALDVLLQIMALLFFRETHYPTLLRRKERPYHGPTQASRYDVFPMKHALSAALRRPLHLLLTQPVLLMLAVFSGVSFGILYVVLSVLPTLFTANYHQSSSIAALNYISFGIGFGLGAQSLALSTDILYRRRKARENTKPELRIVLLLPSIIAAAIGLICIGWSAHAHTHWIVPNIGLLVFGAGTQFSNQCVNAYVIDVYGPVGWSASGMAGIWALKSTAGFAFPLFGPDMVNGLGWGWSNSMLAATVIAVGAPVSLSLQWYGDVFRKIGQRKLQA